MPRRRAREEGTVGLVGGIYHVTIGELRFLRALAAGTGVLAEITPSD